MSLYAEYMLEREDIQTVETEEFFFTWGLADDGKVLEVYDAFVKSTCRGGEVSSEMVGRIVGLVKVNEAKYVRAQVDTNTNHSARSLRFILELGFSVIGAHQNVVTLSIDIKHYNKDVSDGR